MSNRKVVTASAGSGISFAGLLTVLFIALKLTHVIAWSWWWVLAPLWISWAFVLAVLIFMLIVFIGIAIGVMIKALLDIN